MLYSLSKREAETLAEYRFQAERPEKDTVRLADLMDADLLPGILDTLMNRMGALNSKVAASQITKRLSFYGVLHLYALSVWNKRLIVRPEEILLADRDPEQLWIPHFFLGNFAAEDIGERRAERDAVIRSVYADVLTPIVRTLSSETRLSAKNMWENLSVYIFWLYDKLIAEESAPEARKQLEEDYRYMIYEAEGELFGQLEENPFTRFDGLKNVGQDCRVRQTCCFSYLLEGKEDQKCKTCPNRRQ